MKRIGIILFFLLVILVPKSLADPTLKVMITNAANLGADGYTFLDKPSYTPEFRTKVIIHSSRAELKKQAELDGVSAPSGILSYTIPPTTKNRNTCTIHIVDPYYWYEPEIAGHELLHCVYGQWHIHNR